MDIQPIFRSLRKHRIPATLIVLEIALACAVLCNAVFMMSQRFEHLTLGNAIDERGISIITVDGVDTSPNISAIPRDLAALRRIDGVKAAAVVDSFPLSENSWESGLSTTPAQHNDVNTSFYPVGQGAEKALGLRLLQGRFFTSAEYAAGTVKNYTPNSPVTVITQRYAQLRWPQQDALGKALYSGIQRLTVIGVVANVLAPSLAVNGANGEYNSIFMPVNYASSLPYYVLRSAPGDRVRVLQEAIKTLRKLRPQEIVSGDVFSDFRGRYFASTHSTLSTLGFVCLVMLAVTAVGIVGLSSFWVAQRRHTIGIRRALGATRHDILRYFQVENFLLTTIGIAFGMLLAYGVGLLLMQYYELPRLPWTYLPVGAVVLWVIGQLAVLGPALRAAAVPPVVATRSM